MKKKVKRAKSIKNKNFILNNYSLSWKYIKESREFIYAGVIVFFLFALIPFIFPVPEALQKLMNDFIEKLVKETEGLNQFQLIWFIFLNNLKSSFFGLFLGIFFGFFSILVSIANGYVLGYVSVKVIAKEGITSLWRLLPHGIFELPAVFISIGLGMMMGWRYIEKTYYLFKKKNLDIILYGFFGLFFLGLILLLTIYYFFNKTGIIPSTIFIIFSMLIYITFILAIILIDYIKYYTKRGSYAFLIISIITPIIFFNLIFNKNLETKWNRDLIYSIKVFILIIIPLLIIAAIIEGSLIYWIK